MPYDWRLLRGEKRAQFVADAKSARAEALKSGKGVAAADVHAYLGMRAEGAAATKPKAKAWRK